MAFPTALALAADPVASLIDTAFVGRLGAAQLAAVGVSIAIFNQASRITMFPLVSLTTSFVAEEDTMEKMKEEANKASLVHAETLLVQDSLEKGISSPASNNTNQPQQPPGKFRKSHSTLFTTFIEVFFTVGFFSSLFFSFQFVVFWLCETSFGYKVK